MFDYARQKILNIFFYTYYVGIWCLELDNSKESIGSNNPRKNGAQGLDNT